MVDKICLLCIEERIYQQTMLRPLQYQAEQRKDKFSKIPDSAKFGEILYRGYWRGQRRAYCALQKLHHQHRRTFRDVQNGCQYFEGFYPVSYTHLDVYKRQGLTNDYISNRQQNISEMKIHNFNIGLPIPFMIFSKPLKEIMKFNFNPDKINFLYVYAAFQKHELPDMKTKGYMMLNLSLIHI